MEDESNFVPMETEGDFVLVENEGDDNDMGGMSYGDDENTLAHRKRLAQCFENAETMQTVAKLSNSASQSVNAWLQIAGYLVKMFASNSIEATKEDIIAFYRLRHRDMGILSELDMLPYVGKKASNLIAAPHTFTAPAVMSSDCSFAFAGNEREFIYSAESLTKIYIFEDQIIQVHALWDYTTGTLFNEQSEAFFFKDITDISTEYGYERIIVEENTDDDPGCLVILARLLFFPFFLLSFLLSPKQEHKKGKWKRYVRKSETFRITANSGRKMEMSFLCNEWIEAKQGKFEQRTSNEKIFHSIRKMIEEKKAEAANA